MKLRKVTRVIVEGSPFTKTVRKTFRFQGFYARFSSLITGQKKQKRKALCFFIQGQMRSKEVESLHEETAGLAGSSVQANEVVEEKVCHDIFVR